MGEIVEMIEKNVENVCNKTGLIVESRWLLYVEVYAQCSMFKCSCTKRAH